VGYKMRGLKGAVAALLGSVLPSFVIILAIALLFADIRHNPVVKLYYIKMEIESSLKTKWQRIKCKINALLGFYRKTIHIIYL
ncbi:chromate transporter, partial [Phocaeicola sp.]|uniref:chromate transporter n=1 Tax=Phocaeicola sp. TaxID=2773926 RepID=UPI003AB756F6